MLYQLICSCNVECDMGGRLQVRINGGGNDRGLFKVLFRCLTPGRASIGVPSECVQEAHRCVN
jgi:hypothetical protein